MYDIISQDNRPKHSCNSSVSMSGSAASYAVKDGINVIILKEANLGPRMILIKLPKISARLDLPRSTCLKEVAGQRLCGFEA